MQTLVIIIIKHSSSSSSRSSRCGLLTQRHRDYCYISISFDLSVFYYYRPLLNPIWVNPRCVDPWLPSHSSFAKVSDDQGNIDISTDVERDERHKYILIIKQWWATMMSINSIIMWCDCRRQCAVLSQWSITVVIDVMMMIRLIDDTDVIMIRLIDRRWMITQVD